MKKLAITLLIICFTSTVFAHGGRTNKSGCHKQRGYGSHCHR